MRNGCVASTLIVQKKMSLISQKQVIVEYKLYLVHPESRQLFYKMHMEE
jgi:hypothetical protein